MADRVYPSSSKPNPPPAMPPSATPAPPKPKPPLPQQLYNPNLNPTRPQRPPGPYRPNNPKRSRRPACSPRRFFCLCFLYTLILLLSLLLLAAIAASIFYVLYHPKHPTFSVLSLKISSFNLSTPGDFSHLSSSLSFTLSTKNPNSKLSFLYDPSTVSLSAAGLPLGNATLPAFTHVPDNTTVLRSSLSSDPSKDLDSDSVSALKSDLSRKNGFPLTVQLDTNVLVKMGKLSSKKVGIRVLCDGIRGSVPKQNTTTTPGKGKKKATTTTTTTPALATVTGAKCKVDLRIKIWKFTF